MHKPNATQLQSTWQLFAREEEMHNNSGIPRRTNYTEAIMIAMSASVTVSMGELTTGDASRISRVNFVARETCNMQRLGIWYWSGAFRNRQGLDRYLMCGKIYMSGMKDHIVIRVGDSLTKQPRGRETWKQSLVYRAAADELGVDSSLTYQLEPLLGSFPDGAGG